MKKRMFHRLLSFILAICISFLPANLAYARDFNGDITDDANELGITTSEEEDYTISISNDGTVALSDADNIESVTASSMARDTISAGSSGDLYPTLGGFVLWRDFVVNATTDGPSSTISLKLYDPNGTLKFDWTQSSNEMTTRTVYWLPAGTWTLHVDASNSSTDVEISAGWHE